MLARCRCSWNGSPGFVCSFLILLSYSPFSLSFLFNYLTYIVGGYPERVDRAGFNQHHGSYPVRAGGSLGSLVGLQMWSMYLTFSLLSIMLTNYSFALESMLFAWTIENRCTVMIGDGWVGLFGGSVWRVGFWSWFWEVVFGGAFLEI